MELYFSKIDIVEHIVFCLNMTHDGLFYYGEVELDSGGRPIITNLLCQSTLNIYI